MIRTLKNLLRTLNETVQNEGIGRKSSKGFATLAMLALLGCVNLAQAQHREGAESDSSRTSSREPQSGMTTLEQLSSNLENAQKILWGSHTGDEESLPINPDVVRGPTENFYRRYELAMTNLGHMSGDLLASAQAVRTAENQTGSKVQGTDSRKEITATTSFPWRAICSLSVLWPNGEATDGTGFFISRRTVMTAGHVIYNPSRGGWAKQVTVKPGQNGSKYPYWLVTVGSSSLSSVEGYVKQGQRAEYDYGAIVLPTTNPGTKTGYFGYHTMSDAEFSRWTFNVAGYPTEKVTGNMWHATGPITGTLNTVKDSSGAVMAGRVKHMIDATGGQSGAPIWYLSNNSRYVVGIHTGGNTRDGYNWGSRMATHMVSFIKGRP